MKKNIIKFISKDLKSIYIKKTNKKQLKKINLKKFNKYTKKHTAHLIKNV